MKTNRTLFIISSTMILLFAAMTIGNAQAGVPGDGYEPNNDPSHAKTLIAGSYNLTLGYMGDIDYFNVTVTSGDTITINVTTTTSIGVTLQNQTSTIKGTSATSTSAGSIVHVATYTGNHTIVCTNGVSCEYTLKISITSPAPPSSPDAPSSPSNSTPGYDLGVLLIIAAATMIIPCMVVQRRIKKTLG